MRKASWKSNMALKIALIILSVLSWTLCFFGLFGTFYLEQAEIYDAVDEDYARNALESRIAEQYSIVAATSDHYGSEELSQTNFRYGVIEGFTLKEAVAKGLFDDPDAYAYTDFENGIPREGARRVHSYTYQDDKTEVYVPYNLVNDGHVYNYEYETSFVADEEVGMPPEEIFVMTGDAPEEDSVDHTYVVDSTDYTPVEVPNDSQNYIIVSTVADKSYDYNLHDLYNEANTLLMVAYSWNMKNLFPVMAFAGAVLALAVLSTLLVMAGWRREKDEAGEQIERVVLRRRDFFPLDLGIFVAWTISIMIFGVTTGNFFVRYNWLDRMIRMRYVQLLLVLPLYTIAWLLFLASLMSLAANIRYGGAWQRTALYRFFHWIGVSVKRLILFIQGKYLPKHYREMLDAAVEARIKSERFQTELITNVSHDIKTPLTSIINYVDLLSKEELENEKAREYVTVLVRQSERLKKLIQDLIDASKASSGNVKLEIERVNLSVLLTQIAGEYEEKMKDAGIELVVQKPEESVFVDADSRNLSRVFDNLTENIVKYAQRGTRAYLDLTSEEGKAEVIFRNTSAARLNITSEELLRRFARGDESRSTEGSGLGLSIADSLTKLMGGTLTLTVDGDLFKVTVTFPSI